MADITLTIPDRFIPRILEAFAANNYVEDEKTKAQHAKDELYAFIRQTVIDYEGGIAVQDAKRLVKEDVNNELTIS